MKLHRAFLLIIAISLFVSTVFSACTKSSSEIRMPDPGSASLPSGSEILRPLSAAANLAGRNFVVTDGTFLFFNDRDSKFVRTKADGSEPSELNDSPVSWQIIADDQIFYTAGADRGELHKMSLDGTGKVRIGSRQVKNLIYYNDMIYAIEMPEEKVIRVRTDGNGREVILDAAAASMILHQGVIYICGKAASTGLIRYDTEAGTAVRLLQTAAANLQVDKNYLYFSNLQQQYHVYGLDISEIPAQEDSSQAAGINESSSPETASSNQVSDEVKSSAVNLQANQIFEYSLENPFIINDSKLYFIDTGKQNQLYALELNELESVSKADATLVADDAVANFVVLYPYIYYQRPEHSRLYRVIFGNSRAEPVS